MKKTRDGLDSILVWPDLHIPYQHPDAFDFLFAVYEYYNIKRVFSVGDLLDFHAFSFHPKSPEALGPSCELNEALLHLEILYEKFKKVQVQIMVGNHDARIERVASKYGLPRSVLRPIEEILDTPRGWTWHNNVTIKLPTGRSCYIVHGIGEYFNCARRMGMSFVCGHYHTKSGIQYFETPNGLNFAAQLGWLGDDSHPVFNYNKNSVSRPMQNCLVIKNGIPLLIPMLLDSKGRWNGQLF